MRPLPLLGAGVFVRRSLFAIRVTPLLPMKILSLDDDSYRLHKFRTRYSEAKTVETSFAAIALLAADSTSWDLVYLDHDLGGETYVDSNREDTGMEVVRFVESHCPRVKRFVVHSLNYPAAVAMVDRLRNAGYEADHAPFTALNL